jgi:hypothetical protein
VKAIKKKVTEGPTCCCSCVKKSSFRLAVLFVCASSGAQQIKQRIKMTVSSCLITVYTALLAGNLPYIRSYTVHTCGSGQPWIYLALLSSNTLLSNNDQTYSNTATSLTAMDLLQHTYHPLLLQRAYQTMPKPTSDQLVRLLRGWRRRLRPPQLVHWQRKGR